MTMGVGILTFDTPCQTKQNGLSALQFVSTLFELQERPDACQQFRAINRASKEIVCPDSNALYAVLFVGKACDRDDRYQVRIGIGLDLLAYLEAVQLRHHYVKKHQIRRHSVQLLEGLRSVRCGNDLKPRAVRSSLKSSRFDA